jgi:hypothetical protein
LTTVDEGMVPSGLTVIAGLGSVAFVVNEAKTSSAAICFTLVAH